MKNIEIAKILYKIADFLEATKNRFRARAYRRAANVISNLKSEITKLRVNDFNLEELPYVGPGISSIIKQIIIKKLDPISYILNIKSSYNKVQKPPFRLHNAKNLDVIVSHILMQVSGVDEIHSVGELRRNKELINQLEFVAIVNDSFTWKSVAKNPNISTLEQITKNQAKIVLLNNIPIILNVVKEKKKGITLLIETGSEKYINILKKKLNKKMGVYENKTESEIYLSLNLPYLDPELREVRDNKCLTKIKIPKLILASDIKGDLHCHTNETDGVLDLEKIVEYAIFKGYEYLAITDHSQTLKITNGLDKKRLFNQIRKIDKLNSKFKNFTILKSSECDILENGSLDFPDDVLKELDLVVCSVHSKFRLSKEKQTNRILRAMENPFCTILGHPTGRLINTRPPYKVDIQKILQAAKDLNCIIELNCQPYRLDLKDEYCILAKKLGVKIAISSDSHSLRGFNFMELGIAQARRAGLEAKDVINTYQLEQMKKLLRKA